MRLGDTMSGNKAVPRSGSTPASHHSEAAGVGQPAPAGVQSLNVAGRVRNHQLASA